jgi:hypothetical protein
MRIVHKAAKVSDRGVSALCSEKPRAINMKTSTWALRDEAVTCKRCLVILRDVQPKQGGAA